jgi:phage anti-repressor protein
MNILKRIWRAIQYKNPYTKDQIEEISKEQSIIIEPLKEASEFDNWDIEYIPRLNRYIPRYKNQYVNFSFLYQNYFTECPIMHKPFTIGMAEYHVTLDQAKDIIRKVNAYWKAVPSEIIKL